jgi:hypothetical protein
MASIIESIPGEYARYKALAEAFSAMPQLQRPAEHAAWMRRGGGRVIEA